jgi:hypothetical protein
MLIKCDGKCIDGERVWEYTPIPLPPVGSILRVHPFKEIGEEGDAKEYRVLYYEFNIHRSYNFTYRRDEPIMHVERVRKSSMDV